MMLLNRCIGVIDHLSHSSGCFAYELKYKLILSTHSTTTVWCQLSSIITKYRRDITNFFSSSEKMLVVLYFCFKTYNFILQSTES